MKQSLNGTWRLYSLNPANAYDMEAPVPGSLYCALLDKGMIDDPYYRDNEYITTDISRGSCAYERRFDLDGQLLDAERILLKFHGVDTIADIILNGTHLGSVNNMHREYVYDVTDCIEQSGNTLTVRIFSPIQYIEERNERTPLWGVASTMAGYPHIRKAHYMFGWDWGPKLPDMGIWRSVELIGVRGGRIDSIYVRQNHKHADIGIVSLDLDASLANISANLRLDVTVTAPDGRSFLASEYFTDDHSKKTLSLIIDSAQLWYPRGYGEHPLYKLKATLIITDTGETADEYTMNIGLRTITVSRDKLSDGEEFAFTVNGLKIFAMGANYIPEDQLLPRCTAENTEKLLRQCCMANFNMIRVWGGGCYPDDYFYDICDRMGLLVWQDFMFACSVYKADVDFCETVKHELICNVKRLRNHASLALWCGNNEIESMWQYWNIDSDPEYKKDYIRLFEVLIPKVLQYYDPVTFYWPSSPSSGGGFDESSSNTRGDSHYWDVWHNLKPFTEYFKYKFRFCSEYGFESVPSIKTVRSFAEENDLNLCSPVMEAHQKCEQGTEKIMYYLAQMSHYPYSFEGLIYATQMVQADAIRLNVEHMRRSRGICMGSLYWQVNDSNPVISWSSIDCFHRWKALHYRAKHFYTPVLLSADCENPDEIKLNISSERQTEFTAALRWHSRKSSGEIIAQGYTEVTVKPLSAENFVTLTPEITGITPKLRDKAYIEYALIEKGIRLSSGTCMLVQPKAFRFEDPQLSVKVTDMNGKFCIEVSAEAFAKGVCLDLTDGDCIFTDNWFDIHGSSVTVYTSKANLPDSMTAEEFAKKLTAVSYYDALELKPDKR